MAHASLSPSRLRGELIAASMAAGLLIAAYSFAQATQPQAPPTVKEVTHPLGPLLVTVIKREENREAIGDFSPDREQKFIIASIKLLNTSSKPIQINHDTLTAEMTAEGDQAMDWLGELLPLKGADPLDESLASGKEASIRLVFRGVREAVPKALTLHWTPANVALAMLWRPAKAK